MLVLKLIRVPVYAIQVFVKSHPVTVLPNLCGDTANRLKVHDDIQINVSVGTDSTLNVFWQVVRYVPVDILNQ
jgi:hypothetical protein